MDGRHLRFVYEKSRRPTENKGNFHEKNRGILDVSPGGGKTEREAGGLGRRARVRVGVSGSEPN